MLPLLASLLQEITVVGIVCAVFLVLFVVAGVRQMLKEKE